MESPLQNRFEAQLDLRIFILRDRTLEPLGLDGEELLIMKESDIMGVIEGKSAKK